jgi:ABC-type lipoprotein export system ATPase subunit
MPSTKQTPQIQTQDLCKWYQVDNRRVMILDHINLTIERGEFVAIMGPSGSGKTTLMNIIGCLDRPSTGRYLLDGNDVVDLDDDRISELRNRHLGFVFQTFYLIPYISVLDNTLLPSLYQARSSPKPRAEELLGRLGLRERIHFKPNQLSGGQQQRVAIARALINAPEIILADEPTGQLDTTTGEEIMDLLQEANQDGRTIIVVTHDAAVASYAGRTIRILDGKLQ